jgi:hypothetical protein
VSQVLSELGPVLGTPTLPSPGAPLPHDATLEPTDDTIAAVQSLVAASRAQDGGDLAADQLYACICHCTRRAIETKNPSFAVGIAAFALRLAEEHLV